MMGPIWISHRGIETKAPENTLEAFRAAVNLGFTEMETDLRVTADDHIVLCHDPTLDRLFRVKSPVAEMSREELEKLRYPTGEKLLFFDQFIEEFAGCGWTLDIKAEHGHRTIAALVKWAHSRGTADWLLGRGRFLLWRKDQERMLRESFPDAIFYANQKECYRAGLAVLTGLTGLAGIERGRIYSLTPKFGPLDLFQRRFIDRFHKMGALVVAYLPSNDTEARRAVVAGVDQILTNGLIVNSEGF